MRPGIAMNFIWRVRSFKHTPSRRDMIIYSTASGPSLALVQVPVDKPCGPLQYETLALLTAPSASGRIGIEDKLIYSSVDW